MASAGLENLVAQSSVEQFRSLDSISIPSVNSCSHSVLGPTASLPQLPFFAHSSVGSNVRAVGLLSSSYSVTDSAAVAAASQKLSLQSKGKPLTVSLVQQEARPGSLSSAAMPSIQHQLAAGSQNAAFGLINSQLRKAIDSNLAAVLVAPPGGSTAAMVRSVPASVPPHAAYSLSTARVSLPSAGSANIALSSASSASITFPSSVAPFSTVSKPVVARLMAQQRLPGVLALSGMLLCIVHLHRYTCMFLFRYFCRMVCCIFVKHGNFCVTLVKAIRSCYPLLFINSLSSAPNFAVQTLKSVFCPEGHRECECTEVICSAWLVQLFGTACPIICKVNYNK